jgi:hypothetical protein
VPALDDLTDVTAPAPNNGDLLTFTGVIWEALPLSLANLTDVDDALSPNPGDVLTYDSMYGWKAQSLPTAPYDLKPRPLAQVTITTASYNGFSALHHNTHFRSTSTADVSILVQPDTFWTGGQQWWEDNGFPSSPGAMPAGGTVVIGKHAVGNITFVAGPGVVINTPDTLVLNKLHGKVTLIKVGANTWDLEGNLATV